MIQEEFNEFVKKFQERQKALLITKGSDYANEDMLSNFKLAGSAIKLTSEMSALNLISTKVVRLGNLLNTPNKLPKNESIEDTLVDLANYSILLGAILFEKHKEGLKEESRDK